MSLCSVIANGPIKPSKTRSLENLRRLPSASLDYRLHTFAPPTRLHLSFAMSTKSWYVLSTKAIPQRYGLSKNIQILFQSYDHYKMGSIDAAELGRLVRTSPNRRTSLAATISKCAMILKKDQEEVKTCVDIIEMCTEILEIAGKLSSSAVQLLPQCPNLEHRPGSFNGSLPVHETTRRNPRQNIQNHNFYRVSNGGNRSTSTKR